MTFVQRNRLRAALAVLLAAVSVLVLLTRLHYAPVLAQLAALQGAQLGFQRGAILQGDLPDDGLFLQPGVSLPAQAGRCLRLPDGCGHGLCFLGHHAPPPSPARPMCVLNTSNSSATCMAGAPA